MKAWSVIKTILSGFIWGIGQVFNRQYLKALFFFVFFAIFVTLELSTSNYFYEETKENEIALSKISGKSLERWYEKALFQQYDVDYILNGNSIDTFEDFLERSEEHTSELQSRPHLVCRLLLEKKKKK